MGIRPKAKASGVAVEVLVGVGDEDEARGGVAAVAGNVQLNEPVRRRKSH